ncbi:MAG: hypothetical protein H6974_13040 [Gammaproteobacteria bacterium]|nr:hypothetical protein [Gammaproteobacteria bacterium]MCP5197690.1 hypothetical protein [Gammaproteobacteria bacterium]
MTAFRENDLVIWNPPDGEFPIGSREWQLKGLKATVAKAWPDGKLLLDFIEYQEVGCYAAKFVEIVIEP